MESECVKNAFGRDSGVSLLLCFASLPDRIQRVYYLYSSRLDLTLSLERLRVTGFDMGVESLYKTRGYSHASYYQSRYQTQSRLDGKRIWAEKNLSQM